MVAPERTEPVEQDPSRKKAARRSAGGAFAGFFVDMFDVYLPVIALAPAAAYFRAVDISATAAGLISAAIFVATLLGRPLGAMLFGHYADKLGRRRTAIVSVSGFGVCTLLIAVLPGYHQIGIAAVVALIVLRFLDGIFLGGEYTAASPLAMEAAPKQKRGLYGACIMAGFPLAYVFLSLLTLLMLRVFPAGGLNSPYVQWGWRVPFLVGALLAFLFVYFYARHVEESEVWEKSTDRSASPLRELFGRENRRDILQVFVLMTGMWLTLYTVTAILPDLLGDVVGLGASIKTFTILLANVLLVGGYLAAGVLSQRIGRRPYYFWSGVLSATLGCVFFAVLVNTDSDSYVRVLVLTILINLVVVSCWGPITTYINERFRTGVRSSGFGIGYSLAVVLPSFYAFYLAGLGSIMPAKYAPLVLLVTGAGCISIGARMGPETRDVDM